MTEGDVCLWTVSFVPATRCLDSEREGKEELTAEVYASF